MTFKNRLRKLATGISLPQEYCCVGVETFPHPLSVFLTMKNRNEVIDVTITHLFLGYKPLIIGLSLDNPGSNYELLKDEDQICLSFEKDQFQPASGWHGFTASKTSLARLDLKKIGQKNQPGKVLLLYEGTSGEHTFLNSIHQWVNRQHEKIRKRGPGNVGLPGNLFDQVRIAYAIPRRIAVVTVSDGSRMNMFPTDLHGPLGATGYVSSLRIGGLANRQVEQFRKIVISEVASSSFREVYALGKNHMQEMKESNQFSIAPVRSASFDLPLPSWVLRYKELLQVESFDHGIHRIHLYQTIISQEIKTSEPSLAHVHQYLAQWRLDQNLGMEWLVR